jgi:hypothetical protein
VLCPGLALSCSADGAEMKIEILHKRVLVKLYGESHGPRTSRSNANSAPTHAVVRKAHKALAQASISPMVLREIPHSTQAASPPSRLGFLSIHWDFGFREILACLKELRWVCMRNCFRGGCDCLSKSWFVFEERFDAECALGCEDVGKMPSLRVSFIPG